MPGLYLRRHYSRARYRIGAVAGDANLKGIEQQLSKQPKIAVPTIVLVGEDDGVDPPVRPEEVRPNFSDLLGLTILKNVVHNLPQEAPEVFAAAIIELGHYA